MVASESADEPGHRPPALEDWPRGFHEASWWPVITAAGVASIYLGAALVFVARGEDPIVGPAYSSVFIVAGAGIFLAGIYGWLYHGFVGAYWMPRTSESGTGLRWGMILFLVTDVMTFGAGFVYYFFIRTGPWPPGELPSLLSSLVLVNTAVLVTSSVTVHVAHRAILQDDRRRFLVLLAATVALGFVFVVGQLSEYYTLLVEEAVPVTGVFGSAFFALTGLHGLHVGMGVVMLAILLGRGLLGQFSSERHTAVATVSMYWHFVDIVWIFLVVTLYVGSVA